LKLDASGNYQWARNWGAPSSYVAPTAVEIDFEGNPILTGSFTAPTFDLDPNAGTSFAYNSGGTGTQNGFVCKLDSNGDFIWGGGLGGNEHDIIVTVDSDSDGNVYLGGTFDGSGDMDPMSTVQDLTLIGSNSNSFVIKINPVGETQFVHHFGCIQGVDVHTIHLDAVNNKYWISGFNYPETDFDPGADVFVPNGSAGGFVCSYSLDGEFLMHRYVGSSYSDNILLHMNESGDLYLAETCVSAFTMYHPQGAFVFPTAISGRIILLRISNCLEPLLTSVITDPATIVACSNDEILLTALPENAGNSPMFNWYVNGLLNTVDTDMNNEFSFFANFNGPTISCAVISSLGCADGYPSDPTFVDYEVMETFTPTVFIYPTGHCPNEPFILEAYIENGGASPTFQWYQDGELIPGATDTIYTTIGEEPFTEFTVEVYIEETCATENYLISEVQPIVYASMPNVNIYSLENTVYGIPDASNDYQWLDCNNNLEPISGATNTSYTYTGSGSYALLAYNVYCADTSDCLEVTYIPDNIVESDFFGMTIQPNPSQDFIDISCTRGDSKMNIFIYSSRGELAYNAPWKGLTQQRIDLNTLAPGVYYIQLQSNQGISSKKLIVE
jgi:hypothetical protein